MSTYRTLYLTVCYYHVTYAFYSESRLCSCLNVNEILARNRCNIWSFSGSNEIRTHNQSNRKWTLNHLANWPNDWAVLRVIICTVHLSVCYYHDTYAFQSESTFYKCLNVKKRLAQSGHNIRSLCDIQVTIECRFTLKHECDLIITHSQTHCRGKYSQHSSIIWPVWLNGWTFIYKLSGLNHVPIKDNLSF